MMTPHNSIRGEIPLFFAGKTLQLVPTYKALTEIEAALGKGLIQLTQAFACKAYSLRDMVVILDCGLRAGGENTTEAVVGPKVLEVGMLDPDLHKAVSEFLMVAIGGRELGKKPQGDVSAEEETGATE